MKLVKGIAILACFSVLFGSCFDPPEFPTVPEIVFQDITFCDVADGPDTLSVYIKFKDGDGDLGVDPQHPKYSSPPYHFADFYQNLAGNFSKVTVLSGQITSGNNSTLVDVLDLADPTAGDLIFPRTRKNPAYTSQLPPYTCEFYDYRDFVIHNTDTAALDKFSVYKDTLGDKNDPYYVITDTLYHTSNPNHYNIEVDWFILVDPNSSVHETRYREYDWKKERCTTYDGRFPILSETNNTALDGTLRYSMESRGFQILFGGKTMKLRVQIKDRLLNKSNIIDTGDFTLESIRKCGN
ncbi:MAG TPA: hypothetical protein VEB86_15065 [Chryseosolibacter sp.]|nr:hypothetical protein [Chryseosolibacter sp.]